ncbi:GNAT family N-acetyltransferase [Nocardioides salsibiostraticola]
MSEGGVRHARAADLRRVAEIETAGLVLFEEHLGDLAGDVLAGSAPSGGTRLDMPGFLLVLGPVGEPTGFVHVVEIEGYAHLEQLSVRPEAMRRGRGTRLVRAAMAEAAALGFDRLSLCTYRDLPWNGPFYVRLGFGEVHDPEPFQRRLRAQERAIGLDRHGVRLLLDIAVRSGPQSPVSPAPTSQENRHPAVE